MPFFSLRIFDQHFFKSRRQNSVACVLAQEGFNMDLLGSFVAKTNGKEMMQSLFSFSWIKVVKQSESFLQSSLDFTNIRRILEARNKSKCNRENRDCIN